MRRNYKREIETFIRRFEKKCGMCATSIKYLRGFKSLADVYNNGTNNDYHGLLFCRLGNIAPLSLAKRLYAINDAGYDAKSNPPEDMTGSEADLAAMRRLMSWREMRSILVALKVIDA